MAERYRVLFVFVDGVGLGPDLPDRNAMVDHMPALTTRLGAPPIAATAPHAGPLVTLLPIDAVLGHDGLPQSGTGQATLLTGIDAIAAHGRHFGPWVPTRLRPAVRSGSILAAARAAGLDAAFANAYPEEILHQLHDTGRRTPPWLRAGPPLAAIGADLLVRHTPELIRGDALASEITNDAWRERLGRTAVPAIDPPTAARNLLRIAERHDLTLFAHYSTDYAGHRRDIEAARTAITRLDEFLGTLIDLLPDDLTAIVASDHGNVEDTSTAHTRNPAICLIAGSARHDIDPMPTRLTDIAPMVLRLLGL